MSALSLPGRDAASPRRGGGGHWGVAAPGPPAPDAGSRTWVLACTQIAHTHACSQELPPGDVCFERAANGAMQCFQRPPCAFNKRSVRAAPDSHPLSYTWREACRPWRDPSSVLPWCHTPGTPHLAPHTQRATSHSPSIPQEPTSSLTPTCRC
eukprot:364668-Chlamydomonas_euryale.AAC.9